MEKIIKSFKDILLRPPFTLSFKCFNLNTLKICTIEKQMQFLNFVKKDNLDFFINKSKD